jgi:predicted RNA-binding Zn-ribbon protein involved in translation (DUF1610 family)
MCKDVKCPICGSLQKRLNLEETGGWFECTSCGMEVMIPDEANMVTFPVYTIDIDKGFTKKPA